MRAFLVVVLAVALSCTAASCGSSPVGVKKKDGEKAQKPSPVQTVKLAYEKTVKVESAKVSLHTEVTGLPQARPNAPQSMTLTGEGAMDLKGKKARMVMQMPMLGAMEMRYIGSTMYQKMPPAFTAQLPQGKEWVKLDLEKMMRQQYGASLSEMQGEAPSDQLAYLRGVSDSVKELGTEEVRGVRTTHYKADVDLDKAAPKDPEARRVFEKSTENLHAKKIPTEVWLDDGGRVRRYKTTTPFSLPKGTSGSGQGNPTSTTTAEYYDFGVPVRIEAPPGDRTIPFEQFMEMQKQSQQQAA